MRLALLAALLIAGCRFEAPTPTASGPPAGLSEPERAADEGALPRTPPAPPASTPDTNAATPVSSGWVVPVVGVAPGQLADTFGDARSEGRTHNAIDILAPRGTPVVAARAGRVARLYESEKGGQTVYVVSGRMVSYYAHLNGYAPSLEEGQWVRAGGAIGTVGDSGNAQPGNTHLHFALWRVADPADFWDGESVNPYPLLTGTR